VHFAPKRIRISANMSRLDIMKIGGQLVEKTLKYPIIKYGTFDLSKVPSLSDLSLARFYSGYEGVIDFKVPKNWNVCLNILNEVLPRESVKSISYIIRSQPFRSDKEIRKFYKNKVSPFLKKVGIHFFPKVWKNFVDIDASVGYITKLDEDAIDNYNKDVKEWFFGSSKWKRGNVRFWEKVVEEDVKIVTGKQ